MCFFFATAALEAKSVFATVRLSMYRHAANAASSASGMYIRPARPRWMPTPAVITAETTNGACTTATPMLPPAAFRPSAQPFSFSG